MYALAALFLCDWLVRVLRDLFGPRGFDFKRQWDGRRWSVTAVQPSSASERAGLRAGDVLLAFDGRPLEEPSVWRVISPNLETGRTYSLDVTRAGRRVQIAYTVERASIGSRWVYAVWEANGFLLLVTACVCSRSPAPTTGWRDSAHWRWPLCRSA